MAGSRILSLIRRVPVPCDNLRSHKLAEAIRRFEERYENFRIPPNPIPVVPGRSKVIQPCQANHKFLEKMRLLDERLENFRVPDDPIPVVPGFSKVAAPCKKDSELLERMKLLQERMDALKRLQGG
jgi:hypothetical protein